MISKTLATKEDYVAIGSLLQSLVRSLDDLVNITEILNITTRNDDFNDSEILNTYKNSTANVMHVQELLDTNYKLLVECIGEDMAYLLSHKLSKFNREYAKRNNLQVARACINDLRVLIEGRFYPNLAGNISSDDLYVYLKNKKYVD